MSIEIAQVYKSLLANAKPSYNLQIKIFNYASRTKNTDLLARLASHADLDTSVDLLLKGSDYAAVKAAWASRDGRTVQDLQDLVKGEKRVKILQALAEKENLPEELYEAIANQSKGQGALTALCMNQSVSFETRKVAAKNFAIIADELDGSRSSKLSNSVSAILTSSPDLGDTLVEFTNNPILICAASTNSPLNESNQLKVAHLMKSETSSMAKNNNRNGYYAYNWISTSAESMNSFGKLSADAVQIIISAVTELINYHTKNNNKYYIDNLNDLIKELKVNNSKNYVDYVKLVSECNTCEELTDLVNKVSMLVNSSSRNNLNFRADSVALAVIASPYSNPTHVKEMCHFLSWSTYRQALKVTNDMDKIVQILYHAPYIGLENEISKTSDPRKCVEKLVAIYTSNDSQIPAEILNSKFITKSVVEKLPLSVLYSDSLPGVILSMIGEQLENGLASEEAWLNFEAIGSNFNGTIEDLIKVSSTL